MKQLLQALREIKEENKYGERPDQESFLSASQLLEKLECKHENQGHSIADHGYVKCYDCGERVYDLTKNEPITPKQEEKCSMECKIRCACIQSTLDQKIMSLESENTLLRKKLSLTTNRLEKLETAMLAMGNNKGYISLKVLEDYIQKTLAQIKEIV